MIGSPFKAAERLSLTNLQSEVSSLLERLWRVGVSTGPLDGQDYAPPLELREEGGRFVLTAELPGVTPPTLEVTATLTSVTLSGEKPQPVQPLSEGCEPAESKIIQGERRYGRFRRTVGLPSAIRVDGVSAKLSGGILTLDLPKSAGAAPAQVRVEVRQAEG
jgi:HSP20 family protein